MLILFFLSALRSGSDRYYLLKTEKCNIKGSEIFHFLKPSVLCLTLKFYLNYYFRKLIFICICFLPSAVLAVCLFYYLKNGRASVAVSTVIFASALLLAVNGVIYFLRFNSFLFVSRYYFASGGFTTFRQLFSSSVKCIADKKGVIIKQKLRFTGWFISCILVFPIPFVQNYYRESMARFVKDLIGF